MRESGMSQSQEKKPEKQPERLQYSTRTGVSKYGPKCVFHGILALQAQLFDPPKTTMEDPLHAFAPVCHDVAFSSLQGRTHRVNQDAGGAWTWVRADGTP